MTQSKNSDYPQDKMQKLKKIGDEAAQLSNDDDDRQAQQENESLFLTTENKKTISRATSLAIEEISKLLIYLTCIILICRVIHLLIPEQYFWIQKENIETIDKLIILIFGGILSRFIPINSNTK